MMVMCKTALDYKLIRKIKVIIFVNWHYLDFGLALITYSQFDIVILESNFYSPTVIFFQSKSIDPIKWHSILLPSQYLT